MARSTVAQQGAVVVEEGIVKIRTSLIGAERPRILAHDKAAGILIVSVPAPERKNAKFTTTLSSSGKTWIANWDRNEIGGWDRALPDLPEGFYLKIHTRYPARSTKEAKEAKGTEPDVAAALNLLMELLQKQQQVASKKTDEGEE